MEIANPVLQVQFQIFWIDTHARKWKQYVMVDDRSIPKIDYLVNSAKLVNLQMWVTQFVHRSHGLAKRISLLTQLPVNAKLVLQGLLMILPINLVVNKLKLHVLAIDKFTLLTDRNV
jgi:hypothetical protein